VRFANWSSIVEVLRTSRETPGWCTISSPQCQYGIEVVILTNRSNIGLHNFGKVSKVFERLCDILRLVKTCCCSYLFEGCFRHENEAAWLGGLWSRNSRNSSKNYCLNMLRILQPYFVHLMFTNMTALFVHFYWSLATMVRILQWT